MQFRPRAFRMFRLVAKGTAAPPAPPPPPSGWNKEARLAFVAVSSQLTGHVVVIDETATELKQSGNGGVLTSSTAQDVRMEAVADGSVLPWDLWHYDSSTGRLVAAVRLGNVAAGAPFQWRMLAGNSGASEQDMAGTWGDTLAVWLGADGTNRQGTSSRDLTLNSVMVDASEPWVGVYDGSSSKASLTDASFLSGLMEFSIEALVEAGKTGSDMRIIDQGPDDTSGAGHGIMMEYQDAGYRAPSATNIIAVNVNVLESSTSNIFTLRYESAPNVHTTNRQHLLLSWKSGELPKLYVNGVLDTPSWVGRVDYDDDWTTEENTPVSGTTLMPSGALAIGGLGAAPMWEGRIAFVVVRPRAIGATQALLLARNALASRRVYGRSAFTDLDPDDKPVVAMPMEVAQGPSSTVDYDVVSAAVDDGTPTLASADSVSGSVSAASVAGGLLRVTSGATSGAGEVAFTLTGASSEISSSKLYLTVSGGSHTGEEEYPPALRTVNVTNSSELSSALSSARPGDHIVLAAGNYSGVTISVAGTSSNPIVIRPAAKHGAKFTGTVTLTGTYVWLYQLHFDGADSYSLDLYESDWCTIRRNMFTRDNAVRIMRSRDCEIAYNLFELPGLARATETNGILFNPRYTEDSSANRFIERIHVYRNLFTTTSIVNDSTNIRCRAIYVSTFAQPDYPGLDCTIEYNLFDSYGRGRIIYSKVSGITVQYNTIIVPNTWTITGTMALVQRHDYGNTWQGNWIEGGGYVDAFDAASVWNGNKIVGDGSFRLFAGEGDPSALGSHVAANGHTFAWNEGTIKVGYEYYEGNGPFIPADNNRIEAHTGPVELLQWQQNTTITSTSSYTQVVPVKLTRNDVGPDAP